MEWNTPNAVETKSIGRLGCRIGSSPLRHPEKPDEPDQRGVVCGETTHERLEGDPPTFKDGARGGRAEPGSGAVHVNHAAVRWDRPVLQHDPVGAEVHDVPEAHNPLNLLEGFALRAAQYGASEHRTRKRAGLLTGPSGYSVPRASVCICSRPILD